MSNNPLSGYSDAQALRLLWDMAAGVRLELEAAKKRIQELEQECEELGDMVRKKHLQLADTRRYAMELDQQLQQVPVEDIRNIVDAFEREWEVSDFWNEEIVHVREWLEAAKQQQ